MTNGFDILDKSVTRGDQADYKNGSAPYVFQLWSGEYPGIVGLPPAISPAWSYATDRLLRSTIHYEDMWASAIRKAISKQAALGFRVEDSAKSEQRIRRAQQLFLRANGRQGWVHFISQHLRDFLLTDNGAFVEIVRASSAAGSRILGLMHLASSRCRRTGDPEYPVVYIDRQSREHALREYQVITLSDMPRSDDNYFGVGFCAARSVYKTVYKLAGEETYVREKTSGSRALSIHFVNGIPQKTLENAIEGARHERAAKGMTTYMGVMVIPTISDGRVEGYEVPLASVPDGFDVKEERNNAYVIYANAIGVAVQDIQPLSGQGLGTGTQSVILDEAAEGQGLAAWRKQWEHLVNEYILPEATTFAFATNDIRDKKAKAELQDKQAETLVKLTTPPAQGAPAILTTEQALQMAVDYDLVPEEFLPQDETPEGQLTDIEKPAETSDTPTASFSAGDGGEGRAIPSPPSRLRQAIDHAIAQLRQKQAPSALDDRIATTGRTLATLTKALFDGSLALPAWEDQVMATLTEAHTEAYRLGTGKELDEGARELLRLALDDQRAFLDGFRQALADGSLSSAQAQARAQLYAEAVKASYWKGATAGYPLPAWPGDGSTQCLVQCKCSWEIQDLGGQGNADAYWRFGDADHCQSCIERAAQWAPLRIRGGELL